VENAKQRGGKIMTTIGSGKYTYELVKDWPTLPSG